MNAPLEFTVRFRGAGTEDRIGLTGRYRLRPADVLTSSFLRRESRFQDYADWRRAAGLPEFQDADQPAENLERAWNSFVRRHTRFSDVTEMLSVAVTDWARDLYAGRAQMTAAAETTEDHESLGFPPLDSPATPSDPIDELVWPADDATDSSDIPRGPEQADQTTDLVDDVPEENEPASAPAQPPTGGWAAYLARGMTSLARRLGGLVRSAFRWLRNRTT